MSGQTVFVTDGEQRAALALVRSLGRAGYRVHVGSRTGSSLAGASRYCLGEIALSDALLEPDGFVEDLIAVTRRLHIDWLIPVTEASLLAVLPRRNRFPGAQIPFVDAQTFGRISDKALVLEAAAVLGIAVPAQRILGSPEMGAELDAASLAYPLVLKPARSVGEHDGARAKHGVWHVADRNDLGEALAVLGPSAFPLLVQQRIVGPGVGVFLLLWDGELVASFSHRRLREKPPSGGISVYCESRELDPQLLCRSRALLESFGWRGVAMVEYKIEARSGTAYLMEINGRFWGSLQLAVDAGVDFPALLLAAAGGGRPSPVRKYRTGVRSRWWWGDVDHLIARLRRSPKQLRLPPGAPGRWRALLDFARPWRPRERNEVLRADDPRPFLRETLHWFTRV